MEFEEQKIVLDFRRCEVLLNQINPKYNYCLGRKYVLLIGLDYINDESIKRTNKKGLLARQHIFEAEDILMNNCHCEREDIDILLEDPRYDKPTKENLIKYLSNLKEKSRNYKENIIIISGLKGQNGGLLCLNNEELSKEELNLYLVQYQDRHSKSTIILDLPDSGNLLNMPLYYSLDTKKWVKNGVPDNYDASIVSFHPSTNNERIKNYLHSFLLIIKVKKNLTYRGILEELFKYMKANIIMSYSQRDFNKVLGNAFKI